MLDLFQKIIMVLLVVSAISFGVLWVKKIFEYASEITTEGKIKGARLSTIYINLAVISIFLAIEIYAPNGICIPFFFLFIGLPWLNYIVYKRTISFLRKNNS